MPDGKLQVLVSNWLPSCSNSTALIFFAGTYLELLGVADKEMRQQTF